MSDAPASTKQADGASSAMRGAALAPAGDGMSNAPEPNLQQGVSLTQDAWRRLKRRTAAMVALWTLVTVVGLAFLTPILPLQPPDRDLTKLKFAPPQLMPVWEKSFDFDPASIEKAAKRLPAAIERREQAERELARLRAEGASEERLKEAFRATAQARASVDAAIQQPYAAVGFPSLDPLARWMVRTRHALFGEWQLGSVCGRDKLGRDMLSRIFWGARVSLIVGFVATLVSLVIGVTYGAVSGYAGGWVDNLMMRVVDVLYSIPFVFLVIFVISVLSEDSIKETLDAYGVDRITIFYFVVGAIYWLTMARVVRGQVVSLRNEPYIEAAQSLGVSQTAIVFKHVVPNLLSIVLVYLTLTIPRVILFEAFLSFLGLGVEPPDVSWGLLANEGIQVITPIKTFWWLILFPSVAIGATLFALNFLGDGLRDAFDPKMKGR